MGRSVEFHLVALRKESVDRNPNCIRRLLMSVVALRKESVDRNIFLLLLVLILPRSLSARRAWIEICGGASARRLALSSLSARRAWIEIPKKVAVVVPSGCRSPQGERG